MLCTVDGASETVGQTVTPGLADPLLFELPSLLAPNKIKATAKDADNNKPRRTVKKITWPFFLKHVSVMALSHQLEWLQKSAHPVPVAPLKSGRFWEGNCQKDPPVANLDYGL